MKKIVLTFLLSLFVCLSLVACGDDNVGHIGGEKPDGHTYGEWIEEIPATCTEGGVLGHYHCDHCDSYFDSSKERIYDLVIQPTGHDFSGGFTIGIKATCTEDGFVGHYSCLNCNKRFNVGMEELTTIVIPKGHSLTDWVEEVEADCENSGTKGYYPCTECGKKFDKDIREITDTSIPVKDHAYGEWIDKIESDCSSNGTLGHYHCEGCNKDFDEDKNELTSLVIPPKHNYGEWIDEIEADCDDEGVLGHYHCEGCDKDFDEDKNELTSLIIPVKHTYGAWHNSVAASCDEDGVLGHYQCSGCYKYFDISKYELYDIVIPAGHRYGVWNSEIEATCTSEGVLGHYRCSSCYKYFDRDKNELISLVIPMAEHSYGTWIDQVEAECEKEGILGHYNCEGCGKNFDSDKNELASLVIAEKSHRYVAGVCDLCGQPKPSEGLSFTLSDDEAYYILSGMGDCTDTIVVVPSTYEGLPVKEVQARAFLNNYSIKKVILPNGITSIGDAAFYQCYALIDVQLPESLESIGESAFRSCYGLVSITVPSRVTTIKQYAFYDCSRLKEVCNRSSLTIRAGETYYGYVSAYADNVYTPESGESKLEIDREGFIIYEGNILMGYVGNEINLVLPDCITVIGKSAFLSSHLYSAPIATIDMPEGVITIEDYAFYRCGTLTTIRLADSVQSVGQESFWGCNSLVKITLGTDLVRIGTDAFASNFIVEIYNRSGLNIELGKKTYSEIAYYAKNLYTPESGESKIITDVYGFVIYGIDSLIGYIGTSSNIVIPNNIVTIEPLAFYNNTIIRYVELGQNVVSIGDNAFNGCLNLKEIKLNEGLNEIGSFAFNKTALETVIIPTSVTSIGLSAFNNMEHFADGYYKGTAEQWSEINLDSMNTVLTDAISFYSSSRPADDGNSYWHYNAYEKPVKW